MSELKVYKTKSRELRRIPATLKTVLEQLPATTHPMDVLRTGVSTLGCLFPEKSDHSESAARDIGDR